MAVALRGATQGAYRSSATGTVAWPAGTAANDYALLCVTSTTSSSPKKEPADTTGWELKKTTPTSKTWGKRLTAADIAAPLSVLGYVEFLQTFTGCRGVGNVTEQPGATMSAVGAGLAVFGRDTSALTPATGKLHTDVRNPAYHNRYNNVWFRAGTAVGYLALDGACNADDTDGFELLPEIVPSAPILSSPAVGAMLDPAAAAVLAYVHQPASGAAQQARKVRIREVLTATWYYVEAAGTLTVTETAVSSATQSATINASALTTAKTYEWTAATSDDGTNFGDYATVSTFSTASKPTVDSITVTSVAETLTPSVAWTMTAGVGAQAAYRVRLCPSAHATPASPVWDSGVQSSADLSVTADADAGWTNGATLYAWVEVRDAGQWSVATKDDATCTVAWTPPTAPSGVTAANQASGPLRVTVAGITAGYDRLQIQRSTDAGTTWADIVILTPDATSEVVDVPQAGYQVSTLYRARLMNTVSDVELWSAWTTIAEAVASTDTGAYLVSADGQTYVAVRIRKVSDERTVQAATVTYGIGATRGRVDKAVAAGKAGAVALITSTPADKAAVEAFLGANRTCWLRWNPERHGATYYDKPARLIAHTSAWSEDYLAQAAITQREIPMGWIEQ